MKKFEWSKILSIATAFLLVVAIVCCAFGIRKIMETEKIVDAFESSLSYTTDDSSEEPDVQIAVSDYEIGMKLDYISSEGIVAVSSDFLLKGENDDFVSVSLPQAERYTITSYDLQNGYLELLVSDEQNETDDFTVCVKTVNANEVVADAVYEFTDGENKCVLGQTVVGKTGVTVMASAYADESSNAAMQTVQYVYDNALLCSSYETLSVSFGDLTFCKENGWGKSVTVGDGTVCVGNETDSPICIAPYSQTLEGAGMTKEYAVDENTTLLYGTYKDAQSGYQPFIYQTDAYTMKIMAAGQETLESAFHYAQSEQTNEKGLNE